MHQLGLAQILSDFRQNVEQKARTHATQNHLLHAQRPSSSEASRASIRSLNWRSVSNRNTVSPVSRTPCCSLRAALMIDWPSLLIWLSQKPAASWMPPPGAEPNSSASIRLESSRRFADIGL